MISSNTLNFVKSFANTHDQALGGHKIFVPQSEHDDDMSVALRVIDKFKGNKEVIGALAQLRSILTTNDKPKNTVAAIKKLIESGLHFDDEASAAVDAIEGLKLPELSSFSAKLTYRYMLKSMSLNAITSLAATLSWPGIAQRILMARIMNGSWASYSNEFGFDVGNYVGQSANPLLDAIKHLGGTSLADACSWYAKGPYPLGYQQGQVTASDADEEITETTKGEATMTTATMTTTATPAAASLNPALVPIIDTVLTQSGISVSITRLLKEMDDNVGLRRALTDAEKRAQEADQEAQRAIRQAKSSMPSTINITNTGTAGIPNGTMSMVQAETLFPVLKGINLMVPLFTWESAHPDVPAKNDDYIFRREMLISELRCLVSNENAWLVGHTGTGKTTFIEQIAARLNWPVARIAFDSNVDRTELVGRMSLKADGKGGTISEWLPGILERASVGGYILLCDEIDAGHPNSLYTIQPLLEGKPLTLLEDGGRVVPRSPMMRICATGNTTGNGDPSGLYPACRILSAATLDRFQTFIEVPYMTVKEEERLIECAAPGLKPEVVKKLSKFATEMRAAFTSGNLPISYSPRRSVAFAREMISLYDMGFKDDKAVFSAAFRSKLFDASSEEFRQRITEIANNCLGGVDPTTKLA